MEKTQYKSLLGLLETQKAIKLVKDMFELKLAKALNLTRVSAPLFVYSNSGLNDYLNGFERPVSFKALEFENDIEIVHSLAKWKRTALKKYQFENGSGLYTDMNAIRRDENTDELHSLYVDQWDWEKVLLDSDRTFEYLKNTVNTIYNVIYEVGKEVEVEYPILKNTLPEHIHFISTQELEDKYPNLTSKERENAICKEFGSVFIHQIGWPLKSGKSHDGRAPDYDDWLLNGDILVWSDQLNYAIELSSMGIRVNKESLIKQVQFRGNINKLENDYAKSVINSTIPLTIGGGIGQSRLCMFFLKKRHIGEVQVSIWKDEDIERLKKENIYLL